MANWNDHPHRSDVKIWLDAPAIKFQALAGAVAPTSYPLMSVAYLSVSFGAYTDVEVGMTVLFGSTAGADDLGRSYVRLAPSSTMLYFGLLDQGKNDGEAHLTAGSYITVLDDYRIWAKLPKIDTTSGAVRKTDGDRAFVTYYRLPPVIILNCGTAVQADINASTGKATFSFVASSSYATEPGASIASYAYTLPAGATITSGAANTHTVTFTINQGVYWLKLVVTDSNGTTQTRRVRLVAQNNSNLSGWDLQPWDIGDDGQVLTLKLNGPAAKATYPEGSMLIVWHKETYAGVAGSLSGPTGSEHMLFTGWLDTETASTNVVLGKGVLSDTTLRAVDVAGRMKQITVLPISTGNDNTPDGWDEMAVPNHDKLIVRTLHEYSTVLTLCDYRWANVWGAQYVFTRWDSNGGSLWDVVSAYAHAMGGIWDLTFDEWGRLALNYDPQLIDSMFRPSTVLRAIGEGDWTSIKAGRNRAARYRFLKGKAVVPSSEEAKSTTKLRTVEVVAPGLLGGPGITTRTESNILAGTFDLLSYIKHLYARLTTPDTVFEVQLAHGGNAGISPAAKRWVTLTQSSPNAAQRGNTQSTQRMLPLKVRVSYNGQHGLMSRTVTLEKETVGVAAVESVQKQARQYSVSPVIPPGLGFGPPLPAPYDASPPDYGAPTGKLFALDVAGHALATVTDGTNWFLVGSGTLSGGGQDTCSDPYNYGRKMILTTDGLFKADDPYGAPSSASLVAANASLTGDPAYYAYQVEMSINRKGYILVCFGGKCIAYSTDYGATWTQVNPLGGAIDTTNIALGGSPLGNGRPSIAISPFNGGGTNNGWIYVSYTSGSGVQTVKRSKNWGAGTWDTIATFGGFGGRIMIPYKRSDGSDNKNDANQEIWAFSNGGIFTKMTAGGSSATVGPNFPTPGYQYGRVNNYGMNFYTLNSNVVGIPVPVGADVHLFVSQDNVQNLTDMGDTGLNAGSSNPAGITGWSSDPNIYCLWGGPNIFVTGDGGLTYTDITGDLNTVTGGSNLIYAGYDLIDVIPPSA